MKPRYCKRQFQTAKVTLIASGIFLFALWMCYFKFPSIFKHTELVPEQMPFVQQFTSELAENKSDTSGMTTPRIELATSRSAATMLRGSDLNETKEQPVASSTVEKMLTTTSTEHDNPGVTLKEDENEINPNDKVPAKVSTGADNDKGGEAHITTKEGSTTAGFTGANNPTNDRNTSETNGTVQFGETETETDIRVSQNDNSKPENENNKAINNTVNDLISRENETSVIKSDNSSVKDGSVLNTQEIRKTKLESSIKGKGSRFNDTRADKNYKSSAVVEHMDTQETESENGEILDDKLDKNSSLHNVYKSLIETNDSADTTSTKSSNNITMDNGLSEKPGEDKINGKANDKVKTTPNNKLPYVDMNLYLDDRPTNHAILLWNPPDWMHMANAEVDMGECHYTNCRITLDRQQLSNSSAVVLHISEEEDYETDSLLTKKDRNPNQVWVFHRLSQPVGAEIPESFENKFNWSWTYRPSSDIFHPYGALFKRDALARKPYADIFKSKMISAVWFSGECNIPDWIVNATDTLRTFIPVDIYTPCDDTPAQGIDSLVQEYTFYLGFENYLCEDFITEQFFHYFSLDVVVVAIGWGRYEYLPSDIFINIWDFMSLEGLGEYLTELGSSEEMYTAYLKTKDMYKVMDHVFMYRNALCNLCDKLNNKEQHRNVYSVADMYDSLGKCSETPSQESA